MQTTVTRATRILALAALLLARAAGAAGFDLDALAKRAQALAAAGYDDSGDRVPDWLLEISYDQWRDIRFRPEKALWKQGGGRFSVQLFHPGLFYNRVVKLNVVDATGVHPVPFSPGTFDYGGNDFASRVPQDLGYAGLRLHYPLKTEKYQDEVIVFLGASYFRAVGKREVFGLSARGLAIDTALSSGEEFPRFREFWLVRPSPDAPAVEFYALLDGPRATGAYRFTVHPGEPTRVQVESRLFFREPVQQLGIAPLTSMFFHGENTRRFLEDYRPEIHDSDGLLVASATGEWIWRPLDNPEELSVSSFQAPSPRGFGLLQRDRDFDHYQDFETRAERRPSVWVAPKGEWGPGRITLVEIPTRDDTNDNVVVFWVPKTPLQPGTEHRFAYDLDWYDDDPNQPPGGRTVSTRVDRGTVEDGYRFVIDFEGQALERLPAETVLEGVITIGSGDGSEATVVEQQVVKNPVTGGWRLVFQVQPKTRDAFDIRAFLRKGTDASTETWSYVLHP